MASSNREFDNRAIIEGVTALRAQGKVIAENVENVEVRYEASADGPGYATVYVTMSHRIIREEADALLARALK